MAVKTSSVVVFAYGLEKIPIDSKRRTVLVFNLGGGTFDISLLNMDLGVNVDKGPLKVMEVVAIAGDTHLGGSDFDNEIVKYSLWEFTRKHGNMDINSNQKLLRRLWTACERAKMMLSSTAQTTMEVDSLHAGIDFCTTITHSRFEKLNKDLFSKCMKVPEKCLQDAKMDKNSIHDVVLVGGSTRIPKVQNMLKEFFDGKELHRNINPDEAVAYGAAIQASILSGQTNNGQMADVLLRDVMPLSLGVEVNEGITMSVVIPRNTAISTKKLRRYTTLYDYQSSVTFPVYEGEGTSTKDNNLLGQFTIIGIPTAPSGLPQLDITFYINASGVLYVTGEDIDMGRKTNIIITNNSGRLRKEEVKGMVQQAEMHRRKRIKKEGEAGC